MRKYKKGQVLVWTYNDFDGRGAVVCKVVEVGKDYAIAYSKSENMTLWIDKDSEHEFMEV